MLHYTAENRLGFYQIDTSLSSSCLKLADSIKLHQVLENQTYGNLIFTDLLQVVQNNLHQACE